MKRIFAALLALGITGAIAQTMSTVPPGGVVSITAGNGLTGGTVSGGGSGAFAVNLPGAVNTVPHSDARLTKGATNLQLCPYKGNLLSVGGVLAAVPDA